MLTPEEAAGQTILGAVPAAYTPDPDFNGPPVARLPEALASEPSNDNARPTQVQVPEQLQPTAQPVTPKQEADTEPAAVTVPRIGAQNSVVEKQIFGGQQSDNDLKALLGFDRAKLPTGFTSSVNGVTEIADYTTPRGTKVAGNIKVAATIHDESGAEVGAIERTYRKDGDKIAVDHSSFFLDDAVQGSGIGREIFNAQIDNYERLGNISRVNLTAAQVGKYVWTKGGWEWSDAADFEAVKGELAAVLTKRVGAAGAEKLLAQVKTPTDISTFVLDGEKVGKNLLIAREEYIDMSQTPDKIRRL